MIARTRYAGPSALCVALIFFCSALSLQVSANSPGEADTRFDLRTGWKVQSSCQLKSTGERISAAGFRTDGWHSATVPSTVVAALVADKTFPDPYFGQNLRDIPGASY